MRVVLALAALLMLGACNVVVTEKPLFTAADEARAPAMKPGVWRMDDGKCTVDEAKPMLEWPECASPAIFKPGEIRGHDVKEGKDVWFNIPLVLASGNPRIAQIQLVEDVKPGQDPKRAPFGYAAVLPTATDSGGAITAIRYWLVQCGPPPGPKAKKANGDPAMGTLKPLKGMDMKPGDAVCTTTSTSALRAAARASRAWEDKPPKTAHWVRAGER